MKLSIFLPVAVSATLVLTSCRDPKTAVAATKTAPIAVETIQVKWSEESTPVTAPGLLARTLEADLSFKTGGVISEVNVRSGDEVRGGQVLGALRLEELDAALAQAESTLNKAHRDLERAKSLFTAKIDTLENRQNAESQVEQAEAGVRAARFNRQTAVLTAPASGRILARFAEPGEIAATGRKIVRFASDSEGWLVRVGLAQREVARIQIGNEAAVSFTGLPEPLRARVARIAEEAEAASRTTLVELRLASLPPSILRSGMVGRAIITPEKCNPRAVLPLSALVEGDGQKAYVFRVESPSADDNVSVARRISVEVAEITEAGAVLRTPLQQQTNIVTTGAEFLADGAVVLVRPRWPIASK
ncbi:MAG: efflux RND transporter periplasmic adaptor subunit [Chthoniobacteraceae bacterium]